MARYKWFDKPRHAQVRLKFVGGPLDGQWKNVHVYQEIVEVDVSSPLPCARIYLGRPVVVDTTPTYKYKLHAIEVKGVIVPIMLPLENPDRTEAKRKVEKWRVDLIQETR